MIKVAQQVIPPIAFWFFGSLVSPTALLKFNCLLCSSYRIHCRQKKTHRNLQEKNTLPLIFNIFNATLKHT